MKSARFLGASDATIAMLIDTLQAHAPLGRVLIVENIRAEPRLPVAPEGVVVERVFHTEHAWSGYHGSTYLGVYRPPVKAKVTSFFADHHGFEATAYATAVAIDTRLPSSTTVGPGGWINSLCAFGPFVTLGAFVTVNRGALIGHHVTIDDYATIGPGAIIGGEARIHAEVSVGMGAKILEGLDIGARAVIGAGAVVTRSVPPNARVQGVPAKPVPADSSSP